jgi:hypothetical protein
MQTEAVHQTGPNVLFGLLTRQQICEQLGGKNERTIIRYEQAGMPVIVVKGMRLYDPAKVRDWLLSHERSHSAPKVGRPSKRAA